MRKTKIDPETMPTHRCEVPDCQDPWQINAPLPKGRKRKKSMRLDSFGGRGWACLRCWQMFYARHVRCRAKDGLRHHDNPRSRHVELVRGGFARTTKPSGRQSANQ